MKYIENLDDLLALYGEPSAAALKKVSPVLTPLYAKWIVASKFCVLTTNGPEGTDGSPRGDAGPVVQISDAQTLLMPDWRGNNRLDSLRNIIEDGRVSLMFIVTGSNEVVRVNGRAKLTTDTELRAGFERKGKCPETVIVIKISEVYIQCSRALLRSGLWAGNKPQDLPTMGEIIAEASHGEAGGQEFDRAWPERAIKTFW
ncbi:MAG: pyridoxamine 5'-phosphate oxidase family protein [Marinovum sp.]|jgi:hypothetical protein|nr:pyridoxamine 5'-phosphate oxidase family protein [Marinovum sp.]MBT6508502.1 pyridoxamine 5'-phosphate oxidase family protein [Marinovum sp.]MDG2230707.1 pyridoxamine 5'-phosphate oxidase family protein [Paracoccaceae bacterium]